MINSGTAAGLIAHVVFWITLGASVAFGELRPRAGGALFVILWALGTFGLPRILANGSLYVTPYVAILDIVLVLVVFKGDVRLS